MIYHKACEMYAQNITKQLNVVSGTMGNRRSCISPPPVVTLQSALDDVNEKDPEQRHAKKLLKPEG